MKSKSGTSNEKKEAYRSFLKNVAAFKEIDALPKKLKFDDGNETADSLADHYASWHGACHLKFNNSRLKKSTTICRQKKST